MRIVAIRFAFALSSDAGALKPTRMVGPIVNAPMLQGTCRQVRPDRVIAVPRSSSCC